MASTETDEKLASIFLWRIENLSYFDPEYHGRSIDSPSFLSLNLNRTSFHLQLFPKGENEGDPYLALYLYPTYHYNSLLNCEWSFLDADGLPLFTGILQNEVMKYRSIVMPDCPTQKEVLRTRKSSFLPHDTLTIRCRIFDTNKDFPQFEYISAVSRIEVLEESFIWRIEEFSALHLGEEVNTNISLNGNNRTTNLLIKFSLTGESLDDSSVNFKIFSENLGHRYKLKLFISDNEQKGKKCIEASYEVLYDVNEHIWVLPKFLSRQEILESSSVWLCGDNLTLFCKFTIVLTDIYNRIEKSYHGPENLKIDFSKNIPSVANHESKEIIEIKPNMIKKFSTFTESSSPTSLQCSNNPDNHQQKTLAILVEDLMSMYRERILSDFELRSGDVSFPVHKAVLSARSPVFKAMFTSNMQEASFDYLVIPDMDAHTLGRMLTFLYAGTMDTLQWESAAKLYYAADKYQLQSLKRECSSILKSNISISNVSHVLQLADRHLDQELTSFVHDFILNHFDEIVVSKEWDQFMDSSLSAGKTIMKIYKMKLQMKQNEFL